MIAVREGIEIVDAMTEAELHVKCERYSQALERLEYVAERYPRYLPVKEVLAEVFRKTGNSERANEIAREARLVSQQMAHEHHQQCDNSQASVADLKRQLDERADDIIRQVYECTDLEQVLRVSTMRLLETLSADRCVIIRLGQEKASTYEHRSEGTLSALDSKTTKLNFLILKKISADSSLVVIDDPMETPIECKPAVVLPNADLKLATHVMDKIRKLAEKTLVTDSGDPVTVSIGVSEAGFRARPELERIQEELIQKTDANLCEAKRSGRNRVCAHSASEGKADQC